MTEPGGVDRDPHGQRITLTGKQQGWLQQCREYYSARHRGEDHNPPSVELVADALRTGGRWKATSTKLIRDDFRELQAARAIRAMTLATTHDTPAEAAVTQALAHVERAHLNGTPVPPGARWVLPDDLDAPTRAVLALLETAGSGYLGLLTLYLAGQLPVPGTNGRPRNHTTRVPVLFDDGHRGRVGSLELSVSPFGPPGLFPDPRMMAFSELDQQLADSAMEAWKQTAKSRPAKVCILWSVTEKGEPTGVMYGPSLGVAFAVALDDLLPKPFRLRGLRSHKLDRACAVTGALDGSRIRGVEGAANKLEAIHTANLRFRVVAPKESEIDFRSAAIRFDLPLKTASTLPEAIKYTRRQINRTFVFAIALLVMAVVATTFVVFEKNSSAAETRTAQALASATASAAQARSDRFKLAADLTGQVNTGAALPGRTQAFKALASWTLNPTSAARTAMQTVADRNTFITNVTPTQTGAIISLVTTSADIYSTDASGALAVSDLTTLTPEGTLTASTPLSVLAVDDSYTSTFSGEDHNPVLAAVSGRGIEIYNLTPHRVPLWRRTLTSVDLAPAEVVGLVLDISDTVIAVQSDGVIVSWDTKTGAATTTRLTGTTVFNNANASIQVNSVSGVIDSSSFNPATKTAAAPPAIVLALSNAVVFYTPATGRLYTPNGFTIPSNGEEFNAVTSNFSTVAVGTTAGVVYDVLSNSYSVQSSDSDLGNLDTSVSSLTWTGDGKYLIAVVSGGVRVINGTPNGVGKHIVIPSGSSGATITAIAPVAGHGTVIGEADGSLALLDPSNSTLSRSSTQGTNDPVFTPDGYLLATQNTGPAGADLGVTAVDLKDQAALSGQSVEHDRTYRVDGTSSTSVVYINEMAADSDVVVAGGSDSTKHGTLWAWNAQSGKQIAMLQFPAAQQTASNPDIVNSLALDTAHHRLFAGNVAAHQVRVWSTSTWQPVGTINVPNLSGTFALSPDGAALVYATPGNSGSLKSVATPSAQSTPSVASTSPDPTNSSPDASTLLSSVSGPSASSGAEPDTTAGGQLTFIDTTTLKPTRIISLDQPAYRMAFSPDGRHVVTIGGQESDLEVHAVDGTAPTQSLTIDEGVDVAWSPDGKTLAVTEWDAGTLLVDAATLTPTASPLPDPGGLTTVGVAWSPDGKTLAVGTADRSNAYHTYNGPTRLWSPSDAVWTEQMCRIAGSPITPAEWKANISTTVGFMALCPHEKRPQRTPTPYDAIDSCYSPALIAEIAHLQPGPTWTKCYPDKSVAAGGFVNALGKIDTSRIATFIATSAGLLVSDDQDSTAKGAAASINGAAPVTAARRFAESTDGRALNENAQTAISGSATLTRQGIAGVSLGMTFTQATAIDPTLIPDPRDLPPHCVEAKAATYEAYFNPDGTLSYITPAVGFGTHTAEGIKIGDTVSTLKRVYAGDKVDGYASNDNAEPNQFNVLVVPGVNYRIYVNSTDLKTPPDSSLTIRSISLDGGQNCFG